MAAREQAVVVVGGPQERSSSGNVKPGGIRRRVGIRVVESEGANAVELVNGEILTSGPRVDPLPSTGAIQVELHDGARVRPRPVLVCRVQPVLRRAVRMPEGSSVYRRACRSRGLCKNTSCTHIVRFSIRRVPTISGSLVVAPTTRFWGVTCLPSSTATFLPLGPAGRYTGRHPPALFLVPKSRGRHSIRPLTFSVRRQKGSTSAVQKRRR